MIDNKVLFAFDREFAPDGTVLREGENIRRLLTEEEARAIAECEVEMALASEEAETAKEISNTLKDISTHLNTVISRLDQESATIRSDAIALAATAARKIADHALKAYGTEQIQECITEILSDLRSEPRIVIRVKPDFVDRITQHVNEHIQAESLETHIIVIGNETLTNGDCILEWGGGSAERSIDDIETKINQAITQWLTDLQPDNTQVNDPINVTDEASQV